MIVGLVLVALVVWWFVRRARKRMMLAGLVATRPQFTIEPPARRHSARDREAL